MQQDVPTAAQPENGVFLVDLAQRRRSRWLLGLACAIASVGLHAHPPTAAPIMGVVSIDNAQGGYILVWTEAAGQASYTLQKQSNSGPWSTVQQNGLASWSINEHRKNNRTYRVQACNADGCGPWSASITVTYHDHVRSLGHPPAAADHRAGDHANRRDQDRQAETQ